MIPSLWHWQGITVLGKTMETTALWPPCEEHFHLLFGPVVEEIKETQMSPTYMSSQKMDLSLWGARGFHPSNLCHFILCWSNSALHCCPQGKVYFLLSLESGVRSVSRGASLPRCITNPSCRDFSTGWIFWKSLFTTRTPVQLLCGPEWVKFLITETQMNWNHSLVLRVQIFIISATPRLSGQGRWILGLSLKHEDSSHCFVLQIKLAKSAGFGVRSTRDQMCCAWQKKMLRGLDCHSVHVLPPWLTPPRTSSKYKVSCSQMLEQL